MRRVNMRKMDDIEQLAVNLLISPEEWHPLLRMWTWRIAENSGYMSSIPRYNDLTKKEWERFAGYCENSPSLMMWEFIKLKMTRYPVTKDAIGRIELGYPIDYSAEENEVVQKRDEDRGRALMRLANGVIEYRVGDNELVREVEIFHRDTVALESRCSRRFEKTQCKRKVEELTSKEEE